MKKLLLFSLALLALVSCRKDKVRPATLKISAKAGVVNITTKGPIESDQDSKLPQNDLPIFFARATDALSADWTTVTGPQATGQGFVAGIIKGTLVGKNNPVNSGKINFVESQYYNADERLKSWFVSYYPEDNDGYGNNLTNPGKLVWTINGKQDIMFSPVVSGDKITNKSTALSFTLSHKLAWLEFKIESDGQMDGDGDAVVANEAWGDITSIKVKGVSNLYTLTLPSTVEFSGSGDIESWNRSDNAPTAQTLTTTPTFFSQSLVEALSYATDRNYTLLITTTKRPAAVEVPISLTGNVSAQAGAKHVITLTFHATEITATAQITPWTDGAPGSGTVE